MIIKNFKKYNNIKIIGLIVCLIFSTTGFVSAIEGLCYKSCLRAPLLSQNSRSEKKKQDKIDYDGLKRELRKAFDPQKEYSEKVQKLVGRNKFKKTEEGFRLKPLEAIGISYDIGGSNEEQRKILARDLENWASNFFERLNLTLKDKIALVEPKFFHITIVDLIADNNPLYGEVRMKIESIVKDFMGNLPDEFKKSIGARVVGIDMFPPGIIKFKIETDNEEFFIKFRQAVREELKKDKNMLKLYDKIEAFPAETYGPHHATLGYLMEPLEAVEIDELVDAMQYVSTPEKNHIPFNLTVGELGKWDENGLVFLRKSHEELLLVDRVFERPGFINLNALRQLIQIVAENAGLDLTMIRPVIGGSSVHLANEDGYVDLNLINDIDIVWRRDKDYSNELFDNNRRAFANELCRVIKKLKQKASLKEKENQRINSRTGLPVFTNELSIPLLEGKVARISTTGLYGDDVAQSILEEVSAIFKMNSAEMLEKMGYIKGIKRCLMVLCYLNDSGAAKNKFDELKAQFIKLSKGRQGGKQEEQFKTLFYDIYRELSTIKENMPEVIESNRFSILNAIRTRASL